MFGFGARTAKTGQLASRQDLFVPGSSFLSWDVEKTFFDYP